MWPWAKPRPDFSPASDTVSGFVQVIPKWGLVSTELFSALAVLQAILNSRDKVPKSRFTTERREGRYSVRDGRSLRHHQDCSYATGSFQSSCTRIVLRHIRVWTMSDNQLVRAFRSFYPKGSTRTTSTLPQYTRGLASQMKTVTPGLLFPNQGIDI